jgi:hypothetical protein
MVVYLSLGKVGRRCVRGLAGGGPPTDRWRAAGGHSLVISKAVGQLVGVACISVCGTWSLAVQESAPGGGGSGVLGEVSPEMVRFGPLPPTAHPSWAALEGLSQAGLHRVAIAICEQQRLELRPEGDSYALWTVWLIELLARQAVAEPQQSAAARERLDEVAIAYQQADPRRRRAGWVALAVERGRLLAIQAELLGYLVNPSDTERRQRVLTELRGLLTRLEEERQRVTDQLPLAPGLPRPGAAGLASRPELEGLRNEWFLLHIEGLLVRMQCYPAGSRDRVAAATDMLEQLDRLEQQIAEDWSGRLRLQLARAQAWLELGRLPQTMELLQAAQAAASEAGTQGASRYRLAALGARGARGSKRWADAQRWLDHAGGWEASPELALEQLALWLERAEARSGGSDAADSATDLAASQVWLQRAWQLREAIGDRFGELWRLRAEAELVTAGRQLAQPSGTTDTASSAAATGLPGSAVQDLWQLEARQLVQAGRLLESSERLWQAAEAWIGPWRAANPPRAAGDSGGPSPIDAASANAAAEAALRLGLQATAVLRAAAQASPSGRMAGAQRLAELAADFSEAGGADEAHLTAIGLLAEQLTLLGREEASLAAEWLEIYRNWLLEHLRLWPAGRTAAQVGGWLDLAQLLRGDEDFGAATWWELYRARPGDRMLGDYLVARLAWSGSRPQRGLLAINPETVIAPALEQFGVLRSELGSDASLRLRQLEEHRQWLVLMGTDFDWWPSRRGDLIQRLAAVADREPARLAEAGAWELTAGEPGREGWGLAPVLAKLWLELVSGEPPSAGIGQPLLRAADTNPAWAELWIYPMWQRSVVAVSELPADRRTDWLDWLAALERRLPERLPAGGIGRDLEQQWQAYRAWQSVWGRLAESEASASDWGWPPIAVNRLPSDPSLHWQTVGRLGSWLPDATAQQSALEAWRRLAAGHRVGSEGWFEGRLRSIELMLRMGDYQRADQLLRLIDATQPPSDPTVRRRWQWLSDATGGR